MFHGTKHHRDDDDHDQHRGHQHDDDDRDHHRDHQSARHHDDHDRDHDHHGRDHGHDDDHHKGFEILDPDDKVFGDTIAEWTEEWWTWVLQNPLDGNPQFDTTGESAGLNNDGPVFFVAATFGGDPVTRSFEVPDDTPILVPILNFISVTFDSDANPEQLVRDQLAANLDSVNLDSLFAEIDGVEVKHPEDFLVTSDFFALGEAEKDSLLEFLATTADPPAAPGDKFFPSGSTGFWLMIDDLAEGEHTIHFGGSTRDGFEVDVTANILVV
jgi:hypothetical protein